MTELLGKRKSNNSDAGDYEPGAAKPARQRRSKDEVAIEKREKAERKAQKAANRTCDK